MEINNNDWQVVHCEHCSAKKYNYKWGSKSSSSKEPASLHLSVKQIQFYYIEIGDDISRRRKSKWGRKNQMSFEWCEKRRVVRFYRIPAATTAAYKFHKCHANENQSLYKRNRQTVDIFFVRISNQVECLIFVHTLHHQRCSVRWTEIRRLRHVPNCDE